MDKIFGKYFSGTTIEQDEYLVAYMIKHDHFATHKLNGLNGVENRRRMTSVLTAKLNTLGNSKDKEYWMNVIKDFLSYLH